MIPRPLYAIFTPAPMEKVASGKPVVRGKPRFWRKLAISIYPNGLFWASKGAIFI